MDIDFQTLQDAIGFAGDTGSAAQKVTGGLESLKRLFGSSKVGTDPDVVLAIGNMMVEAANTQAANAQLINRLTTLESALKAAQAMQTDFERYELWKSPAGAVVYRLKEGDTLGEPDHFLCPNCVQSNRKSILQGDYHADCPACKTGFQLQPRQYVC